MQRKAPSHISLAGRNILLGADDQVSKELAEQFSELGGRVIRLPEFELVDVDDHTALDETIDNLFGYDWLIFETPGAVTFFLSRFAHLGHAVSELDALRVCASEPAAKELEAAQVHVDVIPQRLSSTGLIQAIQNYLGGREDLRALNVLIPGGSVSSDSLKDLFEDTGARVDTATLYRIRLEDSMALRQLQALLNGGGIDLIVLNKPEAVTQLAILLSTRDLAAMLNDVSIVCRDHETARAARSFDLAIHLRTKDNASVSELAQLAKD
jgi:uroporphyrinogen-III synthase